MTRDARPTRRRRADAGLTLLEVLAAVVIVSVALLSLQMAMSGNVQSTVVANHRRVAKTLLRQKIEEIRAGIETGSEGNFVDEGFPTFTWRSDEEQVDVTEKEAVIQLTVSITYPILFDTRARPAEGEQLEGDAPDSETLTMHLLVDPPKEETPGGGGS